ncbi:MAG: MoxR family ATPase [Chloroflexi bacterium]|nr:MoxR family ATPase [Chloroflexota bacterium]OJV96843.1 MAG: AAA family ATPase [Chloroflexi bacterium 54-19]
MTTTAATPLTITPDQFRELTTRIEDEVGKVIVGQRDVMRNILISIIAGGHVLLEGVPGLGKTAMVRTLGQVLDLHFSRIQFTPDLMPADIVGTNILLDDPQGGRQFRFQPGPVFTNLLLADEINRATPKTQSALLEAMQEKTVTVANRSYRVERPFFVLATQNPIDMEGTYPLPEAQLDRFFFKLQVSFPREDDLMQILTRTTTTEQTALKKMADGRIVTAMGELARDVPAATHVTNYIARLILATHPDSPDAPEITRQYVRFGASPRGAQALMLAAKIVAMMEGRFNVAFDDVKAVALSALRHRLILNFEGEAEGIQADSVIEEILKSVPLDKK